MDLIVFFCLCVFFVFKKTIWFLVFLCFFWFKIDHLVRVVVEMFRNVCCMTLFV